MLGKQRGVSKKFTPSSIGASGGGAKKKLRAGGYPGGAAALARAARLAQSKRDKAMNIHHRMTGADARFMNRMSANLRSIPRGPRQGQKKETLFTQGALKSFQFAPRGHGYYDAFAMKPDSVMVSASTGPATCIAGVSTDVIPGEGKFEGPYTSYAPDGVTLVPETAVLHGTKIIIFNPSSSGSEIAYVYKPEEKLVNGAIVLGITRYSLLCHQFLELGPTTTHGYSLGFQQADADGAKVDINPSRRVESIPLRGSVRIRNITEALSVGGAVRVLRYNGTLNLAQDTPLTQHDDPSADPTVQSFQALAQMVRDAERTRTYTGHELREVHQINTHPADAVRSMTFEEDRSLAQALARPAYNSVIILIDDFAAANNSKNNTYELSFRVQRAARFGLGSLLYSLQKELRVNALALTKMTEDESKKLGLQKANKGGA
jgi:hypothetical protein